MATTAPPQASSIWGVLPGVTSPRKRQLAALQAEARQQAAQRRERVLKHEWACARLCRIFGYKAAQQWNGYLPPARDPAEDRGAQLSRANTSPQRKALVQLFHDVAHFDATGELPKEVLEATQLDLDTRAE